MAVRGNAAADGLRRTTNLPTGGAFTMMGWWYFLDFAHAQSGIYTYEGASAKHELYTDPSGTLSLWDGSDETTGSTLSLNTWYHLALTFDQITLRGYINAVENVTNASVIAMSTAIQIGNDEGNAYADARWAALKILSAVLTPNEIFNEMPYYLPVRSAGLNTVSFCRDAAEAATDYCGIGGAWTIGGTLGTEDGPPIAWSPRRRQGMRQTVAAPSGHPAMRRFGGITYGPRRAMRGVY